ncbi:hypothetical protein FKM82_018871 [Ascaphus truei]
MSYLFVLSLPSNHNVNFPLIFCNIKSDLLNGKCSNLIHSPLPPPHPLLAHLAIGYVSPLKMNRAQFVLLCIAQEKYVLWNCTQPILN